jgi:hypothetical protein
MSSIWEVPMKYSYIFFPILAFNIGGNHWEILTDSRMWHIAIIVGLFFAILIASVAYNQCGSFSCGTTNESLLFTLINYVLYFTVVYMFGALTGYNLAMLVLENYQ